MKNNEPQKKRRKNRTIKYDSDEAVKSALLEVFTFFIFLVATTIVANASHSVYMFYFNQALEKLLIARDTDPDSESDLPYPELATSSDWWRFLEGSFLNDIHDDAANASESKSLTSEFKGRRTVLKDNVLLGPPRIRQIRVQKNSCKIHEAFVRYFNTCYSEYTRDVEEKRPVFRSTKFYTRDQLNVHPVRGKIKNYYGAGYVQNLSYDRKANEDTLAFLKSTNWIDRGTRVVVLEFVLYNPSTLIFDNIKLIAEMPPIGGVVTTYSFQALKLHSLWSNLNYGMYVACGIFYSMVLFYTIREINELLNVGLVRYLTWWSLVDVAVLLMAYLALVYNMLHFNYLQGILQKSSGSPNEFHSIDKICYWNLMYINMMGVCVFLVWIKIFKYVSFNKTMMQFSVTLKRCAKDIFGFAVMFFLVFLAYAQLGLLIFGSSNSDFRTFGISVITLMRMFLGDFEYQQIEESNHTLGPIYFLTYVLLVFFILFNMFLAIINDTYGAVKNEVQENRYELGSFLLKRFQSISRCITGRAKNRTDQPVANSTLDTTDSTDSNTEQVERLRKRVSELIREYFEVMPPNEYLTAPQLSNEAYDLRRLTNRITLLEEVLEQLITDMDRILMKIESKGKRK